MRYCSSSKSVPAAHQQPEIPLRHSSWQSCNNSSTVDSLEALSSIDVGLSVLAGQKWTSGSLKGKWTV